MAEATARYAVVTGANKRIGFAICKQLTSEGITVVLTARDEKRGLEAVEKLKGLGHVIFHQLDVTDPASIGSFTHFIQTRFGKLDILENGGQIDSRKIFTENYELSEACLKTNYYGVKELTKALIPLLQFSGSAKIVNVSSSMGRLENMPDARPKEVLNDVENLTEEKIDEFLSEFLKDFKEGSLETKGWPHSASAYRISKAAQNAYTRILTKKYPLFCINAVCPGHVKTDITYNTGLLTPDEGAEAAVRLALLPHGSSPSGLFFFRSEEKPF
ncbi:(+)-neomenthol dehydrogenase-like isoform X2 [Lotus japonicus]|uniref:(+)-neomenthol dehydrogenase-like isoform X2 n=1 Tax=Lotus japonicus TaxID=34305 RepID=UPI002583FC0C|nr:(+)-neomenthol dehydrogenase-like isoform X2 [Lotus japonicus]